MQICVCYATECLLCPRLRACFVNFHQHVVTVMRASVTASAEDFKQLVDDEGKLDAAARKGNPGDYVPSALMAQTITPQAAAALQSSGIKCLDVSDHPHLAQLAAQKICSISTLKELECSGCPHWISPPPEVAENGGRESMQFLRECMQDGGVNKELALFLIGDGEAGKTSVMRALMNEAGNTAESIGKDTRTVGMDMVDWNTKDQQGDELIFKIKDVGGQHVYMKLHELFVLDRAVYVFLWRADRGVEETLEGSTKWLSLLQSCVPGVAVVPVVTHIDCESADELERKQSQVQQALKKWEDEQRSLPDAKHKPIVRVLKEGHSHGVNCRQGDGIAALRSILLDVAATTRGYREPMPRSWMRLRDKLRVMGETSPFITWDAYAEACNECGIKDDQVPSVTSFLHETCALRYFAIAGMRRRAMDLEDFFATALVQRKHDSRDLGDDARALFDVIDQDKSGAIDKDELQRFLRDHGLPKANIDAMMLAADDDRSGKIEFDEFRKRFENAHSTAKGDVLATTVYLDPEWMVDVLKGIVRHDHAALHQHFKDKRMLKLTLQARRLRVHGIISRDLLDGDYLWPGVDNDYWRGVIEGGIPAYEYERQLWANGAGGLKKVVRDEHDKNVAVGLLVGFNIIKRTGTDILDDSEAASDYFCPDLLPAHKKDTTDSRSLDTVSCPYWAKHNYFELAHGFWNLLFMVIRDTASSCSTSTLLHTFFLLSAKIQISQTRSENGDVTLWVRASTRFAFDTAVAGLRKAQKFYAGMALWQLSSTEISAEEIAAIAEPAQVLVMTAASLVQKNAAAVSAFDDAYAKVAEELASYKAFLERAQTDASLDEETKQALASFSQSLASFSTTIEGLRTRLHDTEADHCTGLISLGDLSAGLQGTLRPQYRRCVRKVLRQGPAPAAAKRNQIVDDSRPMQPAMSLPKLDKALYTALKKDDRVAAEQLLKQGADPSYMYSLCCFRLRSSVAEANKSKHLQDLLHSFGCDDPDLEKSELVLRREKMDMQLQGGSQPFSKPTSRMLLFPEEESVVSSEAAEWVDKLFPVLDDHFSKFSISKEIFSPHRLYSGKAQVVLVLVDEAASRCQELHARFAELERQGSQVIGVPMPGYDITDYNKWWPDAMPGFERHSLFFDCRAGPNGDQWNKTWEDKMRDELMPKIHQFLGEWTESRATPGIATALDVGHSREQYVSKEEMRDSMLPCPRCLARGQDNPGAFKRGFTQCPYTQTHSTTAHL